MTHRQCTPILSDGEYVCSSCGYGRGVRFKRPFSRICFEAKEDPHPPFGLGDRVGQALSLVGVTEERVTRWLGRPCGCKRRREKLNRLGRWASRILSGKVSRAEEYLNDMLEER